MKNVKAFIAVMVVAMASIFIYSCAKEGSDGKNTEKGNNLVTEIRAVEPCEFAMANCASVAWTNTSVTVSLPEYPGCIFEVTYRYRTCPFAKFDLEILTWGAWPVCPAFEADIIAAGTGVGLFLQKTEKKLMVALVNLQLSDPFVYANIPLCGSGSVTNIGFSVASCVKFCFIPVSIPMGELTKMTYIKIPCGDACCRTTFEVCKNANGKLTITQSWSQGTNNCTSQTPQAPCPITSVSETVCVPNCQEI